LLETKERLAVRRIYSGLGFQNGIKLFVAIDGVDRSGFTFCGEYFPRQLTDIVKQ